MIFAQVFQIVEVESDAWVLDVLWCQITLVVYDVAGYDQAISKTSFAKTANRFDVTIPALKPCPRFIKSL